MLKNLRAIHDCCLLFTCICGVAAFAFIIGISNPGLIFWITVDPEGSICNGLLHARKSLGAGCFQSSHLFQMITLVVLLAQYNINAAGKSWHKGPMSRLTPISAYLMFLENRVALEGCAVIPFLDKYTFVNIRAETMYGRNGSGESKSGNHSMPSFASVGSRNGLGSDMTTSCMLSVLLFRPK